MDVGGFHLPPAKRAERQDSNGPRFFSFPPFALLGCNNRIFYHFIMAEISKIEKELVKGREEIRVRRNELMSLEGPSLLVLFASKIPSFLSLHLSHLISSLSSYIVSFYIISSYIILVDQCYQEFGFNLRPLSPSELSYLDQKV